MSVTVEQLKNEKIGLESQLHQIKDRRIEATFTGTEFSEYSDIESISYRISVIDEAIDVAEKREHEQHEREQKEFRKQQRQEQKERARSIADRGTKQIKKAEAAAKALARELSELTSIIEERRIEQRRLTGPNYEINISNDEMRISELIERLLGTIYTPHTNDRRDYGRFHWSVVGVENWSEVYEPVFTNWAQGIKNGVDRQAREAGEIDDDE
ncbi:hypothetical protein OHI65_08510 [Brucella sp. MAB-22]|uniref:hypothetical protein n=1 Tax=Brucella TaxID=234 RepID=UPI000F65ABC5|nr:MULTISPECIES: hypothetical protein [Brucella]RRY16446.1 hypothetical protein EGJ57_21315 [Brucella anthropi]UYT54404.1 hypothetical protein OHI65_08510 [Brucella sp. MAB-22]